MYDQISLAQCSAINKFTIEERNRLLETLSRNRNLFRGQIGAERQNRDDYAGREMLMMLRLKRD